MTTPTPTPTHVLTPNDVAPPLAIVSVFHDKVTPARRRQLGVFAGDDGRWPLVAHVVRDAIGRYGLGPRNDLAVVLNNGPLNPIEQEGVRLSPYDSLWIAPRPRGGFGVDLAVMLALAIASAGLSSILSPSRLAKPTTTAEPDAQRYGFGRFSNDAFVGDAIPVVFGRRKRWGGKVVAKIPIEDETGLGDSRVRMLLCLGWGTIGAIGNQVAAFNGLPYTGVTGVYLNDQGIENFAGATLSGRMGEDPQTVMSGFDDTETLREVGVGGVELRNTTGSEISGGSAGGESFTFTTLGPCDAAVVRVRFATGLYTISGTGQLGTRRAKWRVRTRTHDVGGGTPGAWSDWRLVDLARAEQSEFFSSPRLAGLGGVIVDIEAERVSIESGNAADSDKMTWDSVVEVIDTENTYAGFSLLGLELTAGEQLSGVPRVSVDCTGLSTLRIWDGTSPFTAPVFTSGWSDNPAWIALEIATNTKWGLGRLWGDLTVRWDQLFEWAAHCDEDVARPGGGTRKRYRCNIVLDQAKDGIEWLRTVCRTGECVPVFCGNELGFVFDRRQDVDAEVFTEAHIARDESGALLLEYRRDITTGGDVRPNQVSVQFENDARDGQPDEVAYPGDGEEWLATEEPHVQASRIDGVTDADQAMAHAAMEVRRIRHRSRLVRFTSTKPLLAIQPGDRFGLATSLPGWSLASGRVGAGSTTTAVVLDKPVTLAADTAYSVTVVHADGSVEPRAVVSPAGAYPAGTPIEVDATFTAAPAELDATYAIGGTGIQTKPFLAARIRPVDLGAIRWEVEAVEYDERVYDDPGVSGTSRDYSSLPSVNQPPGPVVKLLAFQRGEGGRSIELGWSQRPEDAEITASFRVYRRTLGTSTWVLIPEPRISRRGAVLEITDIDVAYEFTVVGVSFGGAFLSPYDPRVPIASISFGGSILPPDEPTGLVITNTGGNTYALSWDPVDGAAGYQVLVGGDTTAKPNAGAEDCVVLARTTVPSLSGLELPSGEAVRFFVRAFGSGGRLSFAAATVEEGAVATPPGMVIKHTEDFDLSATGTLSNLAWNGTTSRLELVSAGSPGTWTSDEIDTTDLTLGELTLRVGTANDADDPTYASDPFRVPSIASDQWGIVTSGPQLVGMLMPPWPDEEIAVRFEVRTFDGGVWSDWAPLPLCAAIARTFSKYQVRATLARSSPPYKPAIRSLTGVVIH